MKPEIKKQHIALPAALAAGLLLFLAAGGVYFARYLERQIHEERVNQLVEITAQVQTNLDNALDTPIPSRSGNADFTHVVLP